MKRLLYLFAPGLITNVVKADVNHMQKIMDVLTSNDTEVKIAKEKQSSNEAFEASGDGIDTLDIMGRSSMMQQLIEIMDLDRYGCWCYFDKDHGKGHGQPVDEFDTYCQHLHQGYDCAMLDAEAAGEPECIAWETEYR